MLQPDPALSKLIEPLRDAAIGGILEVMARELEAGADVVPEPELRDPAGRIKRGGPLNLPSRADLMVTKNGRSLLRKVESEAPEAKKSLVVQIGRSFEADLRPFLWDAAVITVFAKQPEPNWAPMRRWFLEWFQSRYSEVAPDLYGAVHRMEGPREVKGGWAFTVDFGSAPAASLMDLIIAVSETGAVRMRVDQE
ncbi:MAG: hypothetical protein OEN23_09865 [Paracoccaceae bacterium]|nr:hypothetical protein [Paracoccaceae bacterium]